MSERHPCDGAVLLVDDDPDILFIYANLLATVGITADATTDPREALRYLARKAYKVIVTDLRMPPMSGLQLVAYIRANELNRTARIVVISGAVDQDALIRLSRLKVVEIVHKPFNADTFVAMVTAETRHQALRPIGYAPEAVELFKGAAAEVLAFYLGDSVFVDRPTLKTQDFAEAVCTAIIPIFGRRVFGSMAVTFDNAFVTSLAKALFPAGTESVGSAAYLDVAAEVLNQIAGLTKTKLEERGALIQIGIPQLLTGAAAVSPKHQVSGRTMSLPFSSGEGLCHVEVCLGNSLNTEHFDEDGTFKIFVAA